MAVMSETVRGGATRLVGAALAVSSALGVSLGSSLLGNDFQSPPGHKPAPWVSRSRGSFDASSPSAHARHDDGFADTVAASLINCLVLTVEAGAAARRKSGCGNSQNIMKNPRDKE